MATLLDNPAGSENTPRVHYVDARGLRCPVPIMKVTVAMQGVKPGEEIQVLADCPTFERDIRSYCDRHKLTLLWLRKELSHLNCRVRR